MASLTHKIAANRRFEFSSSAYGGDNPFDLVSMEGYEAISQPFRFELILVSDNAEIDFDAMLRQPASMRIYAPDGASHVPYHGILAAFEQLHRADGYVFYRAVLVPRLWRLSLFRVSDVYLDERDITGIIEGVLKGSRFSSDDYQMSTNGSYRKRSFVCQYEESNLAFISRWMEKEGMHYYFDHDGAAEKLAVVDRKESLPAKALAVNYRPVDELDTGAAADSVQAFVYRQKPLPHRVLLQEYNYRKAHLDLAAEAVVDEQGVGDVMIYGENFRDEEEGKRYASLRAEEIICGARVYSGESTAVGLRTGHFMELAGHYRSSFNARYLVTEMRHQGSQAGALLAGIRSPYSDEGKTTHYSNSFQAIPANVQFRAERVTPWPRVAGTMNAKVDSEGLGEMAEMDEFGQYKVQLPFDRPGKNANKGSARVRMASPYSGSDHGMHFPLYKGAEVLLTFTDGDPDQPVIVGTVPNSENLSIVSNRNADRNGISTKGGNQMYMSDAKGKEAMWLHSPFHNSSIGIGSTDPRGGGSLAFLTTGSSESITVGNKFDASLASSSSLSVGTSTSLSAALSTSVSAGYAFDISLGSSFSWKPYGKAYGLIEDGGTTFQDKGEFKAGNDMIFTAGHQDVARAAGLQKLNSDLKKMAGWNLGVNLAVAVAAGVSLGTRGSDQEQSDADYLKQKKDDATKVAEKKAEFKAKNSSLSDEDAQALAERAVSAESYQPSTGSQPFMKGDKRYTAIGLSAANTLAASLTTGVMFAQIKKLTEKFGKQYEFLKPVGIMKMDKTGLLAAADFGSPRKRSALSLTTNGFFLGFREKGRHLDSKDDVATTDDVLRNSADSKARTVAMWSAGGELKMRAADSVNIGVVDTSLKINGDELVATVEKKVAVTAKEKLAFAVDSSSITMMGDSLEMACGGSGVVAEKESLFLCGPGTASIKIERAKVLLAAPNEAGLMEASAVGFKIDGSLVKLG
ncbi:type VI secretion system Vgr family protein [Herbaspirillum robiniae]|uniref:Type IV secretion protein Rhs n=1 Tax=Herbaspirillum robiniae TaxID=2014887 RepID=A0A246WKL2_9BURK|nr:type VI secretion system tip protein TssI/VgrG [Herbaspirillum robiniae]OWY26789.1 type IV secretion protein Rhs [Herbaspirillum robiniae]